MVYGYIRVSTIEQANGGFSLEAQRTKIQAYALATDRAVSGIKIDAGASAKSLQREQLQSVLRLVERGEVKTVIVVKLDRLTRSVRDLDTLLTLFARKGVDLVSISESLDTSSAAGRMVLNIMTSVAQWEREAIGERTETVLTYKRHAGKVYSGHPPFGYSVQDGSLIENLTEQEFLVKLRELRERGCSYLTLANYLNTHGVVPRQGGKKWYPASVHKVLHSRMESDQQSA